MAEIKISQLPAKAANLAATDLLEVSEVSGLTYVSKKITGAELIGNVVPYVGATQDVDLGEYELKAGQIELDQSPTGTAGVAVTRWNDSIGLTETTLKGGSVILKNGVDLVARVVNKVSPNTTLTKAAYPVVKISGAQGQRLAVDYAQANNDNNSADTLGVVTETIATNQEGFIMTVGQLEGVNTSGSLQGETWLDGDVLYLSPTVPGAVTKVKPTGATGHIVVIGYVEHAHNVNGKIYVKIMNGWELDELHNVYINSGTLANNDALIYESSTQLWKNKTIATALGYTPVSSVGATAPLTSSGGASPTISTSMATNKLIGRSTAGTGVMEEITVGTGLTLSAGTLSASAGLQYFTEAQNTAAPNATVPVDSLTAVASTTDADFAIIPKGAGAIIADIPDGLVTGGNKRGQYAVDLQMARLTNASVASGNYSVISGGYYNTASNTQATVGGGYQNSASGTQSTIGGGQQNGASADFATVGGGNGNTASGSRTTVAGGAACTATAYAASSLGGSGNTATNSYSSTLGGQSNTASGQHSTVIGGHGNTASGSYSIAGGVSSVANAYVSVALGGNATVNGIVARNAYGYAIAVNGDAQCSTFIMRMRTTDATLTTFTSEGTAAASNNQVILPNNGAFRFKGTIIAKQSGSTNVAAWDIDGLIVRGANAAATTLLIGNVNLVQNTPGWGTPILSADTTSGCLKIQIQGAAGTNIQWVGDIKTTEVIYA